MAATDNALQLWRSVREKNKSLNQWEQYQRKVQLDSFPTVVQFPTGTRCNIRCRFCTDRKGPKNAGKDLSYDAFVEIMKKDVMSDPFRYATKVALYGWGEPLANRDYEKIFVHVKECFPELGIGICSNGVLFNNDWADRILGMNNSDVNFSVNAATAPTFLAITGNKQFDRVVENIRYLTSKRSEKSSQFPYISLSYVANTENVHEIPAFVDLAADLGVDSVLIQDIMVLNEETQALSLMHRPGMARVQFAEAERRAQRRKITFSSFITHQVNYFQQQAAPYQAKNQVAAENQIAATDGTDSGAVPAAYFSASDCFDPWERMMIADDGSVFPCCRFQTLPEKSMGNINTQTFQEIWNGPGYRSLRRAINTDCPPSVCAICPRKAGLE